MRDFFVKVCCMCVAVLMALLGYSCPTFARDDEGVPEVVPNEVIAVLYDNAAGDDGPSGAPAVEDGVAGAYDVLESEVLCDGADGATMLRMEVAPEEGVALDDVIARLEENPQVAFAQPNYVYRLPQEVATTSVARVNDPKAPYQYHLGPWNYVPEVYGWYGANVRDAWDMARCNGAVTIAVLDTGCRATHRDLAPNIDTTNMKDVYYNKVRGIMTDYAGHGTAVCGVLGAVANNGSGVAGTSYNARILPIKVFNNGSTPEESASDSATLVKAYQYLQSLIRTGKVKNLKVINMSLGGYTLTSDDEALRQMIAALRTAGVLTVCSGGNDGDGTTPSRSIYPGDFDECLSVTALSDTGSNEPWSDFNWHKDISAPGSKIYTTSMASDTAYGWESGTSFSAPLVSGVAALLWAAVPGLTVDEAVACIQNTAHPLSPSSPYYHGIYQTGSPGCVDAAAAVAYAIETYGTGSTKPSIADDAVFSGYVSGTLRSTGAAQKPAVSLYQEDASTGSKALRQGVDFEVSYDRNTNPGTAVAVLHGIGAYRGTRAVTFTILEQATAAGAEWVRLSGTARYQTMEAIVQAGWVGRDLDGTVVVATGADFKDALSASGLAGLDDAPVIITAKDELTPEAHRALVALEPYRVYLVGGTAAVSERTSRQIEDATGFRPRRIWGKNSSATSAAIARERVGAWQGTAIIATNKSFKDALSAAPIAYAKGYPVLLADGGKSLSSDVLSALKACSIRSVVIIGGEKAVTPNVVNQLKKAGISNVRRIWGGDAVQTSKKVAEWGLSLGLDADGMGVATSKSYPDALCGAAFCGLQGSVLVLADDAHMLNATFPAPYRNRMLQGYVFGGTSAVGMNTWNRLIACTRTE